MDLRFQSSKWAENIYQRFEALCQEIDDIVSQGTVGGKVKDNCIDTVQDLLPSSMVENGKDESQTSSLRDNNTFGTTYVKPRIGMTEKCAIVDSSENRNEQVPLSKSGTSLSQHVNVLNLENTDTQTVQMDSLTFSMQRKNNEERYLKKHGDCLHPDNSIKENAIERESFDSKILTCLEEDFSKEYFLPKSNERNNVNEIPSAFCSSLACNEGIARTENGGTASSTFIDEFHGVSNEAFIPTLTNEVACSQVKIDCVSENRLFQYFHADKQTDKGLSDGIPSALSIIPAGLKSTEKLGLSHKGESDKCGAESMMETIDLSDEVKLDESRVIVDSKLLTTATSFWPNSHRSYKKILKDAFTSRRRLQKEYEQLTIMYGDFDTVTDRQSNSTVLPKKTTTDLKKISSDEDHEWELL
ncbi:uncharacterized protein LOC124938095 [Impatiens glandulifera]|uniref:uncharacterized protein LOC124938095 n=1 Tax=Impatiens glandulifera TaxID=253017 RepID=UPI001FB0F261|nr:uncharacterized protein LOC124938095 [Impatiens glandulifera]